MRRYASHYLYVPGCGYLKNQVVELEQGRIVRYRSFEDEEAGTEWLPGVLRVEDDGRVFHYYPFDFNVMMPVAETRRRQLL